MTSASASIVHPGGRRARAPKIAWYVVRFEAAHGVGMQAPQRPRVGCQRILGFLRGTLQERLSQRAEVLAEILEDHDSRRDVSREQCSAVFAPGSSLADIGRRHPFTHQARGL
jgi:hypothetical protein